MDKKKRTRKLIKLAEERLISKEKKRKKEEEIDLFATINATARSINFPENEETIEKNFRDKPWKKKGTLDRKIIGQF